MVIFHRYVSLPEGIHHSSDKAIWRLGHVDTFFDHLLKALEELV